MEADHTYLPDVLTSSPDYAQRFSGEVGQFFLDVQSRYLLELLPKSTRTVLEIGAGHGQIAPFLTHPERFVCVHGSRLEALHRFEISDSSVNNLGLLNGVVSETSELPFADRSFEAVVAFRLVPHVRHWKDFISELARVSSRQLLFDIAPISSFNILTPFLFGVKKHIERNTRDYFCHRIGEISSFLNELGFGNPQVQRQFFIPMGVHRRVGSRKFSSRAEELFKFTGITGAFGSPAIISAVRK